MQKGGVRRPEHIHQFLVIIVARRVERCGGAASRRRRKRCAMKNGVHPSAIPRSSGIVIFHVVIFITFAMVVGVVGADTRSGGSVQRRPAGWAPGACVALHAVNQLLQFGHA